MLTLGSNPSPHPLSDAATRGPIKSLSVHAGRQGARGILDEEERAHTDKQMGVRVQSLNLSNNATSLTLW